MIMWILLKTIYVLAVCVVKYHAEEICFENEDVSPRLIQHFFGSSEKNVKHPPENRKDSVEYHLYTQRNPKVHCLLEPTKKSIRICKINPQEKLIILVHGYITKLKPGNLFEVMKDKILGNVPFNVIILDWTRYNREPYPKAVKNMGLVSAKAADMLKYLIKNAGLTANNMIITGHSLGAHMAGYIGRLIPNLGRIDGLDPAGPAFTSWTFRFVFHSTLYFTDANFVRVIHTSGEAGTKDVLGHMDFFPNGGSKQPRCEKGSSYTDTSGDVITIGWDVLGIKKEMCNHDFVVSYYIDTIDRTDCRYLATKCDSYEDFEQGKCPPSTSEIGDMGFYGEIIIGLPLQSKFFLRTRSKPPYCLKDGFKPLNP